MTPNLERDDRRRSAIADSLHKIGFSPTWLAPHQIDLKIDGFGFSCNGEEIRWATARKIAKMFGTRAVNFSLSYDVYTDTHGTHIHPGFTVHKITAWPDGCGPEDQDHDPKP